MDSPAAPAPKCYLAGGRFLTKAEYEANRDRATKKALAELAKSTKPNKTVVESDDTKPDAKTQEGQIEYVAPSSAFHSCTIHGRTNIRITDMDEGYIAECGICKARQKYSG